MICTKHGVITVAMGHWLFHHDSRSGRCFCFFLVDLDESLVYDFRDPKRSFPPSLPLLSKPNRFFTRRFRRSHEFADSAEDRPYLIIMLFNPVFKQRELMSKFLV